MKLTSNIFVVTLIACMSFFPAVSRAELATTDPMESVYMVLGELETYPVKNLTRLSVADPGVADIVSAESEELLLIAKSIGTTTLFIWDDAGKRTVTINVFSQNLGSVQKRLSALFVSSAIDQIVLEKNEREGKVVITGFVPDHKKEEFNKIIEPFSDSVIDFTKTEEVNNLVQIDLQITELNTTLSQKLGIDWSSGTETGGGISLSYPETIPTDTNGSVRDLLRIGEFGRTTQLLATVQALIQEGEGKILSQPRLVVMSGEEANFLVGGEVPIRTSTVSETGSTENVTFKDYGIGMTVTPTIKEEKVDIKMNIEVSDIDSSTASAVSETVAFSTRSASTRVFLDDGQTIILAGLIKKSNSISQSRVPFLSKIPIAGLLFRQKSNPVADQDQELVIAMTPHILSQSEKAPVKESASQDDAATGMVSSAFAADMPEEMEDGDISGSSLSAMDSTGPASSDELYSDSISSTSASPELSENISTSPAVATIPNELQGYVTELQKRITAAAQYPQEAREYGWEGTVKLNLLILNDGTLAFALIKESSGYEVFDEYALRAAKSVAPYESFPANTSLQELNVTIPIVYNLNKS